MHKLLLSLVVVITLATTSVRAEIIGIWSNNASAIAGAQTAVTTAGHTPVVINSLSDPLGGFGVVWVLQSNNGSLTGVTGNEANLASFVQGGGVLSFHDRYVSGNAGNLALVLPGAAGTSFVRDFANSTNIQVEAGAAGLIVIDGPGGVVTNTNLDNGSSSSHGYAVAGTLPAGAVAVLNNGVNGQIVDFYYPVGAGWVYYSTIPLDYYFSGGGNVPGFVNIYAPNEAAFQASLAAPVPEPASMFAWGLIAGVGAVGYRLRNRKAAAVA